MRHKLVVFDWNGTILSDTTASWRASNICLKAYGADEITLARYRATASFPVIHFYAKNGVSVDDILSDKTKDNQVFRRSYEEFAKNARTRRGARDLLSWLHSKNVSCIILSNYTRNEIEQQLRRLKISQFFQHVDANDGDGAQILEYTSKQKRLSEYMLSRGYRPHDAVIIGDSSEEPAVARALGLTSIAITEGSFSRAQIAHANPDYTINNMKQARPILEKLLCK